MSKVKGPLQSEQATGKLGKALIFRNRKGTKFASRFYYPGSKKSYTKSASQETQRQAYLEGTQAWGNLSPEEKGEYIARAMGHKFTGYNLFMKEYLEAQPEENYYLLLETDDYLLLESGFRIKLE